jgi:hypothetical protein
VHGVCPTSNSENGSGGTSTVGVGGLRRETGLNVEASDDEDEETDCDVGIRSGQAQHQE